jgi:glutamate N-acetyltransferase/amino-acid N-acetyltransferase
VLVNAGNANCATGPAGFERCKETCYGVASHMHIRPREVFPSSTGVIGVPLPAHKILDVLPDLVAALDSSPDALAQFARAIMTTDTVPKIASASFRCGRRTAHMVGVAKGAGMIHPNMATMLAYILPDAAVAPRDLPRALNASVAGSFNSISIDGDTSTNDTALVLASGVAGKVSGVAGRKSLQKALDAVCLSLAEQIVRDGEGVQHLVRLHVEGARSDSEARQIANVIATSALVKTAFAGADPNWGRILAAAGRSGIAFDPARVDIYIGKQIVCRRGTSTPFDEATAHHTMSQPEYDVRVTLGRGKARVTVLTCDLTDQYVHINADYRS